jgi:hypothetical protein
MNAKSIVEISAGKSVVIMGVSARFGPYVSFVFIAVTTAIVLLSSSWVADENLIINAQLKGERP